MSLEANIRYRSTWTANGVQRDLGNGREKEGGEVTVLAGKTRPGAGEGEVVHTGPKSQDNITLTYELWRIRPNLQWMRDNIEQASATLSGQVLEGNVPVETLESVAAVPIRIGEITADASGDDTATIEIEYMIGARL